MKKGVRSLARPVAAPAALRVAGHLLLCPERTILHLDEHEIAAWPYGWAADGEHLSWFTMSAHGNRLARVVSVANSPGSTKEVFDLEGNVDSTITSEDLQGTAAAGYVIFDTGGRVVMKHY